MPRMVRIPTRANRLANALTALNRAQTELGAVRLTGLPRPQAAEIKAAREALKLAATAADAALRAERPSVAVAS